MNKAWQKIHQLENLTLFALFTALFVFAFGQVVLRNFFDTSIVWADIAVRVLVLWITVFGAMIATRRAEHIRIDILPNMMNKRLKHVAEGLCLLVAAGVAFVVVYYSFALIQLEWAYPSYAFSRVPTWAAQGVLPFGFGVMGVRFLRQSVAAFKQVRG